LATVISLAIMVPPPDLGRCCDASYLSATVFPGAVGPQHDETVPLPLRSRVSASGHGAPARTTLTGMPVRRLISLCAFALLLPLAATACTMTGPGTTSECTVGGCTITFE